MPPSPNHRLQNFSQGILLIGVLLILLGLAAIVAAVLTPSLVGLILSGVFLIAGGVRLGYSWQTRLETGFWLKVSTGILYLIASLLLFTTVLQRDVSLFTLLGAVLLLQGILELFLAQKLSPSSTRRWLWGMALGALVLGGFFLSGRQIDLAWLLGVMAALSLILPGGWLIFMANNMPSAPRPRHKG